MLNRLTQKRKTAVCPAFCPTGWNRMGQSGTNGTKHAYLIETKGENADLSRLLNFSGTKFGAETGNVMKTNSKMPTCPGTKGRDKAGQIHSLVHTVSTPLKGGGTVTG